MKKKVIHLVVISVTLLVTGFFVAGCEPTDWDVSSNNWKLWGEGTIASKNIVIRPGSKSKRILSVTFDNGDEIFLGHLKNADKMKVGQTGYLYKSTEWNQSDSQGYFQWVADVRIIPITTSVEQKVVVEEVVVSSAKIEPKPEKTIVVSVWNNEYLRKPSFGVIVLVRLDDQSLTTAYWDSAKKWKLGYSRDGLIGSFALDNVTEWAELDVK